MIIYEVMVINIQGCIGVDVVIIFVDEVLGDVILDEFLVFCLGEVFSFCLFDDNYYFWISFIGFIQIGNCLIFFYIFFSVVGEYVFWIKFFNGCWVLEMIILNVDLACYLFSVFGVMIGQQVLMDRLQVFFNLARIKVQLCIMLEGYKIF